MDEFLLDLSSNSNNALGSFDPLDSLLNERWNWVASNTTTVNSSIGGKIGEINYLGNDTVVTVDNDILKGSNVSFSIGNYYPELGNLTENEWDQHSGDDILFDGLSGNGESPDSIKQIYDDLTGAALGSSRTMNAGYLYDQSYIEIVEKPHSGIDIKASIGDDIQALTDGTILWTSDWNAEKNGYFIAVQSPQNRVWVYGHLESLGDWQIGAPVQPGEVIGEVGSQLASNAHFHLAVGTEPGSNVNENTEEEVRIGTVSPLQAYWEHKQLEPLSELTITKIDNNGVEELIQQPLQDYDPSQNLSPNFTVEVEDGGETLHLTGNGWQQIDLPYSITSDTMLEFEFKSTAAGEIHGIGFDDNNLISPDTNFKLYGNQTWGVADFNNYASQAGDWKSYQIPVGEFFTGDMNYLTFVHDHDGGLQNAESWFRNLQVYEEASIPEIISIPTNHWNASFINRSSGDVADYNSYDFSQPDVVQDLGSQENDSQTIARLSKNYGNGSPDNIQNDYFSMEAWTRISLQEGKFYKLTSDSDDGTRFLFKDSQTEELLTELEGDWRNRGTGEPTWGKLLNTSENSQYDFYVQYYENQSGSAIDILLEETPRTGKVVYSSGLNLRDNPSTISGTPIDGLGDGETFTIVQKVPSPDDSSNPYWYEVITNTGQQGYVAAGSNYVDVIERGKVVYSSGLNLRDNPSTISGTPIDGLGNGETFTIVQKVKSPDDTNYPNWYEIIRNNGTHGYVAADSDFVETIEGADIITIDAGDSDVSPDTGIVSSVRVAEDSADDRLSFRSAPNTSADTIDRLSTGTSLTILEKVTGGWYSDAYDQWYKVEVNINGQEQEGYVAAYYIDTDYNGDRYPTFISEDNTAYLTHFNEIIAPDYYSTSYKPYIEEVAAQYDWLTPSVIAGIGSRESAWGVILSPPGPSGTGDGGHGRGLMQIDDRFHSEFINSGLWKDPFENIEYGAKVLFESRNYIKNNTNLVENSDLLRAAIAGYNTGPADVVAAINDGLDVDISTTGDDYSWDVLNRASWFQVQGWE
ncbi:MAG: SH3 domain-containing protein [Microcoleaceae cyanobacterium]